MITNLQKQWQSPNDILSVLLILGPDVIQRSLAQLVGSRLTPAVFSFGWVAYAVSAILSAVGDGHLMPPPDTPVTVIGAKSGHVRSNMSWILGRLYRDFEYHTEKGIVRNDDDPEKRESLRVSVFEVSDERRPGVPTRDWVWCSGFLVLAAQVGIAIVPLVRNNNWSVLLIVLCGTLLALLHGALPQWRRDKWAAMPVRGGWTVSLTRGNGCRHVMVILGNKSGFDIEILAAGSTRLELTVWERLALLVLAALWIVLLITVAGFEVDTWYLMGIGLIGIAHNLLVAGISRSPSAHGFHLELVDTITANKVAKVLRASEERYPLLGSSLVPIFFPGGMRTTTVDEQEFWMEAERRRCEVGLQGLKVMLDTHVSTMTTTGTGSTTAGLLRDKGGF